jgi:uncharacterized protein YqjF (DUF2071 family)
MQRRPFLTARWEHLAMISFEADPAILAPYVPAGTELDFHNGRTFISIVGFVFRDTRLRGWAIPRHRNFEELNLRFYVRHFAGGELRRGVVFIKEIVPRHAVTAVARWVYGENYATHAMRSRISAAHDSIDVDYTWRAGWRWHRLAVRGIGPPAPAAIGSEEQFITEHYWGYSRQRDGSTFEYEVAHPSWNLWTVRDCNFDCDAAELYGPIFARTLAQRPSSVLLADGSPIRVFPGAFITSAGKQSHQAFAAQQK